MLHKLSVRNFAVISQLEFTPQPGLNVFTGETGAGKSVAISALSFALGARGSISLIKDGQDQLEVCAEFDAQALSPSLHQKYAPGENRLLLMRTLDRKGKSKAFINRRAVPAAALAEIGKELVDFHGQHEHQSLLRPEIQLQLLDQYAGLEDLRRQTATAYQHWRQIQERLQAAQMNEQEKARLLDLYTFQLQEIETTAPQAGEDAELEQKLPQLKHAGRLSELAGQAYQSLYEDECSATALLGRAIRHVREMADLDEHMASLAEKLEQTEVCLSDACAELGAYQSRLQVDPQTLDQLLSRHEKIKRLKLKYGPQLTDVLQKAETLKEQIDNLQNSHLHEEELRHTLQKARTALDNLCETLHTRREQAAQKLAQRLVKEITPLGFQGLVFEIAVEMDPENPSPAGADHVEFLFSPNPGQAPRSLALAASGGELSRVMLGLKTVLAGQVPVMVFDEVDSGVGGRTAALVGEKLHAVAQGRQVLCVTHLACVAACANAFFHIEKTTDGKTTEVSLRALHGEEITRELARMLGAASEKDRTALQHAQEMRRRAQKA